MGPRSQFTWGSWFESMANHKGPIPPRGVTTKIPFHVISCQKGHLSQPQWSCWHGRTIGGPITLPQPITRRHLPHTISILMPFHAKTRAICCTPNPELSLLLNSLIKVVNNHRYVVNRPIGLGTSLRWGPHSSRGEGGLVKTWPS